MLSDGLLEQRHGEIVIINPRFEISFWGLEHCMPLFGKRANLPVANLALLAALVPKHHEVTLIDENVEDIDFERVPPPTALKTGEGARSVPSPFLCNLDWLII